MPHWQLHTVYQFDATTPNCREIVRAAELDAWGEARLRAFERHRWRQRGNPCANTRTDNATSQWQRWIDVSTRALKSERWWYRRHASAKTTPSNFLARAIVANAAAAALTIEARGLPEQPADDTPIDDFAGVLATLQRHYEEAEARDG